MPAKKSPALLKGKVVGARFNPHEQALIEIARGARPAGTWLRDVALAELAKVKKALDNPTK